MAGAWSQRTPGTLGWSTLAAALALGAPAHAHAQVNLELGARTGLGLPFGDDTANDTTSWQVPLWVDAGVRLGRRAFVGAFFQYGFSSISESFERDCEDPDNWLGAPGRTPSCRAGPARRLGLEALLHLGRPSGVDPWVGAGAGYEWLGYGVSLSAPGEEARLTATYRGFELLNLQGGVDFPIGESVAIGPFTALTLGRYRVRSFLCEGPCGPDYAERLEGEALHGWVFLGARVTWVR